MYYPTSWDPFFTSYMTLHDLYRYQTRHFDFHRRQLTPCCSITWTSSWILGSMVAQCFATVRVIEETPQSPWRPAEVQ
jgi:hypothetical protein